jgi:hypothetical protein
VKKHLFYEIFLLNFVFKEKVLSTVYRMNIFFLNLEFFGDSVEVPVFY